MVSMEIASEIRARTRLRIWSWEDTFVVADMMVHLGTRFLEQLLTSAPNSQQKEELRSAFYKQLFLVGLGADAFATMYPDGVPVPDSEFEQSSKYPSFAKDDGANVESR